MGALANRKKGTTLTCGLCSGYYSCGEAGRQGSLNYERQDAATFASWGADYLKVRVPPLCGMPALTRRATQYDNCFADSPSATVSYNPSYNLTTHFTAMRDALAATGRPILFSVCEWGVQDPARWPGSAVGNSWRMS
jgi:alpha-galactosidase